MAEEIPPDLPMPPTQGASRRERLAALLAKQLPLKLAAEPERVLVNLICAFVGLAALVSRSSSIVWPASIAQAWAVTMVVGGLCALVGYWADNGGRKWTQPLGRAGFLALLIAATAYGVQLINVFGWRGVPVGGAFIAIGAAKGIRLLLSTAARAEVLRTPEEHAGGPR